jgi:adenosylcobinamide-GDP ribazoletransferase
LIEASLKQAAGKRPSLESTESMKHLIAALQFTTILPVGRHQVFEPAKMLPFFPVVGLLLGGLLCAFDQVMVRLWSSPVVAVFDVLLLVAMTGAFHLDGLADAADGLYGRRDRDTALRIMQDSRIGAMGVVAVVSVLALKWAGFMELGVQRPLMLVIIPSFSRASSLIGIRLLRYGRSADGLGHAFFQQDVHLKTFWPLIGPIVLALAMGVQGVIVLVAFFFITAALVGYYKWKIGCVTGDMLGAMIEITEAGLLIAAAAGQHV